VAAVNPVTTVFKVVTVVLNTIYIYIIACYAYVICSGFHASVTEVVVLADEVRFNGVLGPVVSVVPPPVVPPQIALHKMDCQ
jgi:hypothetical protein